MNHIDRAAEVIYECNGAMPPQSPTEIAHALKDDGLLVTPAHDAAVAARAIASADDMTLAAELVKRGFLKAELTLDRIEREGGESDA